MHHETDETLWVDFMKEFRHTFLCNAPEQAYAQIQKLVMTRLEIDDYISQFELLFGQMTWSPAEKGTLTPFQGGLPAWLICHILNQDHRPDDLDGWQHAARREVATEIELQTTEAQEWRRSPGQSCQSLSE